MSKFIRNLIIIVLGLGIAAAVFLTFQPEKKNGQTFGISFIFLNAHA